MDATKVGRNLKLDCDFFFINKVELIESFCDWDIINIIGDAKYGLAVFKHL